MIEMNLLLSRGYSERECLDTLRTSAKGAGKKIISSLTEVMETGASFPEALLRFEPLMPPGTSSVLRSGERSGILPGILGSLTDFMVSMDHMKEKTAALLRYPLFLAFLFSLMGIAVSFVLKEFAVLESWDGSNVRFGSLFPLQIIPSIILLIISSVLLLKKNWLFKIAAFLMKYIPFFRVFVIMFVFPLRSRYYAFCSRLFSIMLEADLPEKEILRILNSYTFFAGRNGQFADAVKALEEGSSLADALQKQIVLRRNLPVIWVLLARRASDSLSLAASFRETGETYARNADRLMRNFICFLNPILLSCIGVFCSLGVIYLFHGILIPLMTSIGDIFMGPSVGEFLGQTIISVIALISAGIIAGDLITRHDRRQVKQVFFLELLDSLLAKGIPFEQVVSNLFNESGYFRKHLACFGQLRNGIPAGLLIKESRPAVLPAYIWDIISAGLTAGKPEEAIRRSLLTLKNGGEWLTRFWDRMFYPVVALILTANVTMLSIFILPKMAKMLYELGLPVSWYMNLWTYSQQLLYLVPVIILVQIVYIFLVYTSGSNHPALSRMKQTVFGILPGTATLLKVRLTASFLHSLSLLLESGISERDALYEIESNSLNPWVAGKARKLNRLLEDGIPLDDAVRRIISGNRHVKNVAEAVLLRGSSRYEYTLRNTALFLENRFSMFLLRLGYILPVLIVVAAGAAIGFLALMLFNPLFMLIRSLMTV